MEKCWRGDKARRPRIQAVVEGVGDAAANWHTEMPPGGTEHQEEKDSGELDQSEFRLLSYHVKFCPQVCGRSQNISILRERRRATC